MDIIRGPLPGENNFYDNLLQKLLQDHFAQQYNDSASPAEQAQMHQDMLNNRAAADANARYINAIADLGLGDMFAVPDRNTILPDDAIQFRAYPGPEGI
jgi:hypothetical protein